MNNNHETAQEDLGYRSGKTNPPQPQKKLSVIENDSNTSNDPYCIKLARIRFLRGILQGQIFIYNLNNPETQRLLKERRLEVIEELGEDLPF